MGEGELFVEVFCCCLFFFSFSFLWRWENISTQLGRPWYTFAVFFSFFALCIPATFWKALIRISACGIQMSNLLEISLPFYPPPSHVAQPLLNFPSPIPTCSNTPATQFPKALQIFELREGWGEKCRFLQRSKSTNSTALLLKRITDKSSSRIEPITKESGEIYSFRHHQTVVRPVCDTKGKLWGCPRCFSI